MSGKFNAPPEPSLGHFGSGFSSRVRVRVTVRLRFSVWGIHLVWGLYTIASKAVRVRVSVYSPHTTTFGGYESAGMTSVITVTLPRFAGDEFTATDRR